MIAYVDKFLSRSCWYLLFKYSHKPTFFCWFLVGSGVALAFLALLILGLWPVLPS